MFDPVKMRHHVGPVQEAGSAVIVVGLVGAWIAGIIPEPVSGIEDCGGFKVGLLADLKDGEIDFPRLAGLFVGGVKETKPWMFIFDPTAGKQV